MGFHVSLELLLVVLTIISGIVLLYYYFSGKNYDEGSEPVWLDYSRSFFPILLVVLVVRSFVAEPFRIPSGSMIPTLEVGDFVLVKKYSYGIKLPVLHKTIIETGAPKRGDVVVFRYPPNPKINYIKRLIGLPGDHIKWTADKRLFINGKIVSINKIGAYDGTGRSNQGPYAVRFTEKFVDAEKSHDILELPSMTTPGEWKVPEGNYFMMGDNRDNSRDSRAWNFVPEKNLVGKASLVWMHWDWGKGGDGFQGSRIGTSVD